MRHINKYFNPLTDNLDVDLVVMRQVLEHINNPVEFINAIVRSFRENSSLSALNLYIEVPSHDKTKMQMRFADFYYEHCNYFTLNSLAQIAIRSNGSIRHLSANYHGEINTMLVEFQNSKAILSDYACASNKLASALEHYLSTGGEIAFWGASGNGITLLNSVGEIARHISYVIDSDSRKQGLYIPVTGQEIVSPSDPRLQSISCIVIASQFHVHEIAFSARKQFGAEIALINAVGVKI